jgi:hypothetical protein
MLNNRENFLQRVRIAMIAIVTIMSVGGAYAMKAPAHTDAVTYGVIATVGNSYHVTASAGRCNADPSPACKVSSSATPDSQGLIPQSSATVVQRGAFTKN